MQAGVLDYFSALLTFVTTWMMMAGCNQLKKRAAFQINYLRFLNMALEHREKTNIHFVSSVGFMAFKTVL